MLGPKQISCEEAVRRLYEFLDSEGGSASLDEVDVHLDVCRSCCDRFAFEATLWKVVRRVGGQCHCPDSLRDKVHTLLAKY